MCCLLKLERLEGGRVSTVGATPNLRPKNLKDAPVSRLEQLGREQQLSFPTTATANTPSSPSRRIMKTVTTPATTLHINPTVTHAEGDNPHSIHELQQEI
jgi:hypothetical protein